MYLVSRNPTGQPAYFPQPSMAWWDSNTATIIKYSLLGTLLLVLLAWIIIGSIHARRRVENGQEPLRYHRWLVPKSHRHIYWQQNSPAYYGQTRRPVNPPMQDPPPLYSAADMPPTYQPPLKKIPGDTAIPLPTYAELEGESSRTTENGSRPQ